MGVVLLLLEVVVSRVVDGIDSSEMAEGDEGMSGGETCPWRRS